MKPPDPAYGRRVRDSFARQPFMSHLGARLTLLRPGLCQIELDRRPELLQQHGVLHGGVIAALCDNAGAYAAYSLMPSTATVLAVELKVNFLEPARAARVRACGKVVRLGRTLAVTTVELRAAGAGNELYAVAQQTVMQLDGRSDLTLAALEAVEARAHR